MLDCGKEGGERLSLVHCTDGSAWEAPSFYGKCV